MTKHISCYYKYKSNGATCNSNKQKNNVTCKQDY